MCTCTRTHAHPHTGSSDLGRWVRHPQPHPPRREQSSGRVVVVRPSLGERNLQKCVCVCVCARARVFVHVCGYVSAWMCMCTCVQACGHFALMHPYFPCTPSGFWRNHNLPTRVGHALNNRSSRAHVIFTVEVVSTLSGSTTQLTLVDLAGSERIKETESTGRQLEG